MSTMLLIAGVVAMLVAAVVFIHEIISLRNYRRNTPASHRRVSADASGKYIYRRRGAA